MSDVAQLNVCLVRAEGHQIDLQFRQVDRHLARGLGRIDMEDGAIGATGHG